MFDDNFYGGTSELDLSIEPIRFKTHTDDSFSGNVCDSNCTYGTC